MSKVVGWQGPSGELAQRVMEKNLKNREAYAAFPERLASDFRSEQEVYEGDYRRRQVFELIQNGADAIAATGTEASGRVQVLLTDTGLYCANEGQPFTEQGIDSLRFQLWSSKTGNQIGRFGRGFKSVLALTDQPRIYSRSGSFSYSRRRTRQYLLEDGRILENHVGGPHADEVPILAIAEAIDPEAAAREDSDLASLMSWAVTVVHLPFSVGGRFLNFTSGQRFELIENDLKTFESEFLIFAKHVHELDVEVRGGRSQSTRFTSAVKPLPAASDLPGVNIFECTLSAADGSPRRWTLLEAEPIDVPATVDGLSINRRRGDDGNPLPVPLSWAIPATPGQQLGRFWSFFPTRDETSLRGILNAPWDTNTERTHLLDNHYNRFLVDRAADLVVRAVPFLHSLTPADPGLYLEYLPARGREERNKAAEWIAADVKTKAAQHPTIPDVDGTMRLPGQLRRPPDSVPSVVQSMWAASPAAPRDFVHPSVGDPDKTVRTARVRDYMEAAAADAATQLPDWLGLLVQEPTPEHCMQALEVARALGEVSVMFKDRVAEARVVLLQDGSLAAPDPTAVYLPVAGGGGSELPVVDPNVAKEPRSLETLREFFGLRPLDDVARLEQLLGRFPDDPQAHDWDELWAVAGTIDATAAAELIKQKIGVGRLQVRALDGSWQPLSGLLLVGDILRPDKLDEFATVDEGHHANSLTILRALGLADLPSARGEAPPWLDDYRTSVLSDQALTVIPQPAVRAALSAVPDIPTHLHLIKNLSDGAAARFCSWAARLPEVLKPWKPASLDIELESPTRWFLRQFGVFETSKGPQKFSSCLVPDLMNSLGRVLPVASIASAVAADLQFESDPRRLPADTLRSGLERLHDETDNEVIGKMLAAACGTLEPPSLIRCRRGQAFASLPPSQVVVVADPALFEAISRTGSPVITVPSDADAHELISAWGLRGREAIEERLDYEATDDPALLADEFFLLGEIRGDRTADVRFQHCSRIARVVRSADGRTETEVDCALDGEVVLVRCGEEEPEVVLRAASTLLGLELTPDEISAILDNRRSAEIEEKISQIRQQPDDESRVRALLPADLLRQLLPAALLEEVGEAADDPAACAGLALAVHGPQLLFEARLDLERLGFRPPKAWAGGRLAVRFVKDLGFDLSFAGFKRADRSAELRVAGPTDLKPLHDYQERLAGEVQDLIRHPRPTKVGGWRGLLYLPTGAGKTRVAVQAVLEMVENGELADKVILWIAQTDELCEQAVQAFRDVWGAMGTSGDLMLGRLWDKNHVSPAAESTESWTAQVVVATIAKLTASVVGEERYEWLRDAAVVIADEAHLADSSEYTRTLRWLGTGVRQRGNDLRPLLGLTATPFKTGEAATRQLQSRFGRRLLQITPPASRKKSRWSVTEFLRAEGVLARAEHEVLEGMDVELADDELREMEGADRTGRAMWLPSAVEGRIAANHQRNDNLVRSIEALPADWPVIVFAISVAHAQVLAARLKMQGIAAAAVSASTAQGTRHHLIKEFRAGRLRVITNYGVLTTGFDAPETRAIYIARPTFSQSLYMQMIGRGLRGPKNGGKDSCLIVDVKDNIERFAGTFAYDEVGHLWDESAGDDAMDAEAWAALDDDLEGDDE